MKEREIVRGRIWYRGKVWDIEFCFTMFGGD